MAKRITYNRALGRAIARGTRPVHGVRIHVMSGITSNWSVVREGNSVAVRNFNTRPQAVAFAKKYAATNLGNEVVVHSKLGEVTKSLPIIAKIA